MDDPPLWFEAAGFAVAYALFTVGRSALVASVLRERQQPEGQAAGMPLPAATLNTLFFLETFFLVSAAYVTGRAATFQWTWVPLPAAWLAAVIALVLIRAVARALLPAKAAAVLGYFVGPVVKLAAFLLWPVFGLARALGGGLARLTRAGVDAEAISPAAELLRAGEAAASPLAEEERDMIDAIFDFRETVAKEVMIPRVDMVTADVEDSIADIKQSVVSKGVSRIPVVNGTPDNVVGILHAKDIFKLEETGAGIKSVLRQPLFVPETKKVNELLREFRAAKSQLAIVVDEYGGTAGLVTLEDLLEEIVGEIRDEYDADVKLLEQHNAREWLVAGRMDIGELNEQLGLNIPEEDFETLGGFVSSLFGKVPAPGDAMEWGDYRFDVTAADVRRVNQVRLTRMGKSGDNSDD